MAKWKLEPANRTQQNARAKETRVDVAEMDGERRMYNSHELEGQSRAADVADKRLTRVNATGWKLRAAERGRRTVTEAGQNVQRELGKEMSMKQQMTVVATREVDELR
ncbi:hypothetical protein R1flu_001152 [Riccia fluitans]|uniref:Uncharacterized protein n=1 Tax=Riccia fluitans TaxID=41844 RepID=A0ABD1Y5E7_9MARC